LVKEEEEEEDCVGCVNYGPIVTWHLKSVFFFFQEKRHVKGR